MSGKSAATLLVEIAEDLFTFGCVTEATPLGQPERVVYEYASPSEAPDIRRPLETIRPDLAAVYEAKYDKVPSATALGDCMTVLLGKCRAGAAEAITREDLEQFLVLLNSGSESTTSLLVNLALEVYRLGVTATGEPFAVPVDGPNVARLLRGGRRSVRADLARR